MRRKMLTGLSLAALAGMGFAFERYLLGNGTADEPITVVSAPGASRVAWPAPAQGQQTIEPMLAAAAAGATVAVDAASDAGGISPYVGKYNNIHGRDTIDRVGSGDQARIGELGTVTMRGFVGFPAYLDPGADPQTDEYDNYDVYNEYLSKLSSMTDQIMLSVTAVKGVEDGTISYAKWRGITREALEAHKRKYTKIRYIEALNEPDCGGGDVVLSPSRYFVYYQSIAAIVREINAELNPPVKLEVGGPVLCGFNDTTIRTFLQNIKNTGETFNFLSYHQYKWRDEPIQVQYEYPKAKRLLQEQGLSSTLPVFVSEAGIFPGPTSTSNGIVADRLMQAAGLATLTRYYLNSGNARVMQWVVHHNSNSRKDQMSPMDGVPYPYYNAVRMLAWLYPTTRLTTTFSPIAGTGQGVQGIGTKGPSGVTLMFWNYQPQNLSAQYDVNVAINNLGSTVLNGRNIHVERYLIDQTHSNYDHAPNAANLDKIVDAVISPRSSYSSTTLLKSNGLSFIRLTPTNNAPTQ